MASATMVPHATQYGHRPALAPPSGLSADPPSRPQPNSTPGRVDYLIGRMQSNGLSQVATDLIAHSWRERTNKQYESAWQQWLRWCCKESFDPYSPSISDVVNFLAHQCSTGKSYSTINSYRSALSSAFPPFDGHNVGKHPLVLRLMKGIFNTNPPKPRYQKTWDVASVLKYICSLPDNKDLTLPLLTRKLVALMALTSAQRTQTLMCLSVTSLHLEENKASFKISDLLKTTSKSNFADQTLTLSSFGQNSKLCVVKTLREYLDRTKSLRTDERLFVSTIKPHKGITSATLARWMKTVLRDSGIDTSVFKAHSFRGASTSCALAHGVSLHEILKTANWSRAETFRKFYHKPISDSTFANAVLNSVN
ncbi:uncharacterized protein [Diadema setosum]|uniref:uncharacterized protein n=1 Tax=Diadema setosum TaxID=31175 RepID=UPI003B3A5CF5